VFSFRLGGGGGTLKGITCGWNNSNNGVRTSLELFSSFNSYTSHLVSAYPLRLSSTISNAFFLSFVFRDLSMSYSLVDHRNEVSRMVQIAKNIATFGSSW
jgi:hypothetical protein